MSAAAYYNEIDPFAAQWLRNLIAAGHIAPGEVDERSIEDVTPDDLRGFTQCHFFSGIGVWSHSLRLAGWPDDRPVWTVQTVLAEEMADAAQSAMLAATGFDADLLLQTLELTDGLDMPDQSRARLHKAIGAVLSESNPASALNHLNHALQLDPRCGVKKDKQQLERRLRNDSR